MTKPQKQIEIDDGSLLEAMSIRLPAEVIDFIDTTARRSLRNRSDVTRSMLISFLRDRGIVAPLEGQQVI